MAKAKQVLVVKPTSIDVAMAQKAFDTQLAELERLSLHELQEPRVDLQLAAAVAHSIATRDAQPARRKRLTALGEAFDVNVLDGLPARALSAFHTRRKQLEAFATSSDARIPEATLRDAQAQRSRMLRVLTYYFEEEVGYSQRLSAIRAGAGYLDLANDLLALAELYAEPDVAQLITQDTKYYLKEDVEQAGALAQQLFRALGLLGDGEAARWTERAKRAWTLLFRDYEALSAAGKLSFRNDEEVESSYPSLITAVRAAPSKPSPQAPATPATPGTPAAKS